MSILNTIEKDINIGEVWISTAVVKVKQFLAKGESLAPDFVVALANAVQASEDFLAAATPAVAGEGLNFPADSVAYAKFVALVSAWQKLAALGFTDVKTLVSEVK